MSEKRTVTVSITINLGNYENLRLEVSDTAETKEDADALRYFLADVLDGYANNNATAKAAVDKYKERILADREADAPMEEEPEYCTSFFGEETELFVPEAAEEPVLPLMETAKAEPEEPAAPSVPAEPDVSAPPAEFTCTKCGAPVTKLQRDVSMLFNHKILCKDCMK